MHNHKYVVCYSESGVETVTLYEQAHQPLLYLCCISISTEAALLGCTMQDAVHKALQRLEVFLSSSIQIVFQTQK